MKHEELVAELEELARRLGVTVRYEKGDFEGGFCILRDQRLVLVNKKLTPQRKATVLALAMQDLGLDSVFVKPALRAYIEDEVARTLRSAQP